MRMVQNIITSMCFIFICMIAKSDAGAMTQDEFNQLISGNTMRGVWAENNYQQYFDPGGQTIYQEENKPETFGIWRINAQAQFCSIWPPSKDEFCYNVTKDGDALLWDDGQGNFYRATIEQGKSF